MKTLAILPVKSFGSAKQRLSESLGAGSREALAQAMFIDVLRTLRRTTALDVIAVVTGDRVAESAARGPRVVVLRETEQRGHSHAAGIGVRHALAHGFDRVVMVPGDTPLLQPADVEGLLEESEAGVTIVPDRHGTGTNALVLAPPDAMRPSFGPDSLARHVAAAEDAGFVPRVEEVEGLSHDVDTPDDLEALAAELERCRRAAPLTRGTLRQIGRSGSRAPAGPEAPARGPRGRSGAGGMRPVRGGAPGGAGGAADAERTIEV
jgi:2-phospho-L-lactate/phosphoenolpyruvate guanylyltransferase